MLTKQHLALPEAMDLNTFNTFASLQQLMNQDKTKKSTPAKPPAYKYRKYDFKKRNRLIEMVEKQNKSLASSAKELGIAQTTARLIMKTWHQEARVFQKKVDRIKREKKEALKQTQARKKEKYRLKKLAKKQPPVIEASQQPRNEIKVEQSRAPIIEEQTMGIMPQIPLQPVTTYNAYGCQPSVFFIYPSPYFY